MTDDKTLYQALGRLEGKMDAVLSKQVESDTRQTSLEARVTTIEALVHKGAGLSQAASWLWVVAAATAGLFAENIKGLFHL